MNFFGRYLVKLEQTTKYIRGFGAAYIVFFAIICAAFAPSLVIFRFSPLHWSANFLLLPVVYLFYWPFWLMACDALGEYFDRRKRDD